MGAESPDLERPVSTTHCTVISAPSMVIFCPVLIQGLVLVENTEESAQTSAEHRAVKETPFPACPHPMKHLTHQPEIQPLIHLINGRERDKGLEGVHIILGPSCHLLDHDAVVCNSASPPA